MAMHLRRTTHPPSPRPSPTAAAADVAERSCPPHLRGANCDEPAFMACAEQWGLALRTAPCFWASRLQSAEQFPASCACLLQCDAAAQAGRHECLQEEPVLAGAFNLSGVAPPWLGGPPELRRKYPELRVH